MIFLSRAHASHRGRLMEKDRERYEVLSRLEGICSATAAVHQGQLAPPAAHAHGDCSV